MKTVCMVLNAVMMVWLLGGCLADDVKKTDGVQAPAAAEKASLAGDPVKIDFKWSFKQQAAKSLFDKKDYPAAQKALEYLVATAPNEGAKLECLSLAAIALGCQRQYDPAMQAAQRIPDAALADYTRMEIMTVNGKNEELIAAYASKDFAAWPEDLRYKGYLKRGDAYIALKNNRAAVRDLEQAAGQVGAKLDIQIWTLTRMGALYESLHEVDKALDAYRKGVSLAKNSDPWRGYWRYSTEAVVSAVRILVDRKKYDEALVIVAAYPPERDGIVTAPVAEAHGDVYAALGKKEEALSKYRESLLTAGKPRAIGINKKMDALK